MLFCLSHESLSPRDRCLFMSVHCSLIIFQVVYKHDTVRVLEMCVKYGTEAQKEKLFELFKSMLLFIKQSSIFVVPKQKEKV